MAQRRWLAKVLMYLVLELGALVGVPVRPDDIERISRLLNGAVETQVAQRENDGDGDPPE